MFAYADLRDKWMIKPQVMQDGFTLIEMMVAMIIGLILMAGIYTNFIMQSRVQTMQSDVTERMEDLYLASHIMQGELRVAKTISISTANRIDYTDLEDLPGWFTYTPANGDVCWNSPIAGGGCQELIRNMDTSTGLVRTSSGSGTSTIYTITLNAAYLDNDHNSQTVGLTFKIWPRN